MKKLAGGNQLSCEHRQWISPLRARIAAQGLQQRPVWCVECEDWVGVVPEERDPRDDLWTPDKLDNTVT